MDTGGPHLAQFLGPGENLVSRKYSGYQFLFNDSNFMSFWAMLYNTVLRLPSYKVFVGKAIFILRQNREKSKKIPRQLKENQEPVRIF